MTAYTDDDVTAAAEAFALAPLGDDREVASRILDAVAPQIAARALREAADELPGGTPWCTRYRKWLRARAEQVES